MAYPCALEDIDRSGFYLVRSLDPDAGDAVTVMQRDRDGDWWAIGTGDYGPGHQWQGEVLAKISIPRGMDALAPGNMD
ncbi:protein of unknown function (plasmid) [Magnetospirillum sp. XM-1]|uniref:hypothetical protein n=1 Tax=Magnetospirillum sp. XM-1 TaxID=1663591 RepID=UPI00073DCB48|nr:hypothetical protein [Magnetospirillum sp. XM-1]CUW41867.1 protein of unknown function [Magnetospirillum sp. XM-1]